MNEQFRQYVESLQPLVERLLAFQPFTFATLPKKLPEAGVYLFTENGIHLYVGRTNTLRKRLQQHCRPGSTHNHAPFAFLLARLAHGTPRATYKTEGSRKALAAIPDFARLFTAAKGRLRGMEIRVVEEKHPLTQALLEMYVAVSLNTKHNDFDNH
jgi:predicted GIY-YIG superfamily endonuclease